MSLSSSSALFLVAVEKKETVNNDCYHTIMKDLWGLSLQLWINAVIDKTPVSLSLSLFNFLYFSVYIYKLLFIIHICIILLVLP